MTTQRSKRYLELLQGLICERYRDLPDALTQINRASESGELTDDEHGSLSREARFQFGGAKSGGAGYESTWD